jgi:Protein of unknown function (DUF742).
MPSNDERWLDAEAGPVVRPYALTQGRTRHTGESFDLVATVMATQAAITDPGSLAPEHMSVLQLARAPTTVADIASTSISRSAWSGSSSPTCGSSAWS